MSPALVRALAEMPKGLAAPSCAQLAMSGVAAPPPWSSKCYAFLEPPCGFQDYYFARKGSLLICPAEYLQASPMGIICSAFLEGYVR